MQTAASINLILTDSSSLMGIAADAQGAVSYGGFYQLIAARLLRGVDTKQIFREIGNRLVVLAEQAHAVRQMDLLEHVSQILTNPWLPQEYVSVGRYYQALCIQRFGYGDLERGAKLLEGVSESGPLKYRARALISLAASSRTRGDSHSALSLYCEAGRFALRNGLHDPYAAIQTQRMAAVIGSEDGNHRDSLALLEKLFPLANAMRSSQPHVYYDYLNSLAVELCEVGRLEEARNVSGIVLASPFAGAYPEWRETREDIELRGWRAPRSKVALSRNTVESENLVRLPVRERYDSVGVAEQSPRSKPARVISMQRWKERVPKQSNGNPQEKTTPQPATTEEKLSRHKELEKLPTRDKLLRIMAKISDERVGDDVLLRALIILEDLELEKNQEN